MSPRLSIFALVCLAQLAVAAGTILDAEEHLREGRLYRFRTAPVDPTDLLRGRYVALRFLAVRGPWRGDGEPRAGMAVCVGVEQGEDGFARITQVAVVPPSQGDWFRASVARRAASEPAGDQVEIRFPLDRFYLPEAKAPAAERLLRAGSETTWADVRLHEGRLVLEEVRVDGVPLADFVEGELGGEDG